MEKITLEINIIKVLSKLKLENNYYERYSFYLRKMEIIIL